jgi:uncharacterized membrane protein YfhO
MQLKNWNLLRIIRLVLAIFISIEAIYSQSYWLLIPGVILFLQALLNLACPLNSCSVPINNKSTNKEIQYEELGK